MLLTDGRQVFYVMPRFSLTSAFLFVALVSSVCAILFHWGSQWLLPIAVLAFGVQLYRLGRARAILLFKLVGAIIILYALWLGFVAYLPPIY